MFNRLHKSKRKEDHVAAFKMLRKLKVFLEFGAPQGHDFALVTNHIEGYNTGITYLLPLSNRHHH